ncbi:pancreas/duodenum homeobox protein 1 [Desulfosarcina ovata]|uniref:Pancreas/duodenum homeobox protein 1 n=2 Tax=Desulfosarcina ovata TaxID=83564 RepID=A0A5K8A4I7_9BACT|nr:pancreas/duodenum homeobox protein 1 [Desulfosarcina ovata]BBO80022.1 hypothetical protein DSCO28_05880 [Desulfosarcina ovata subsp. sediminis]BBO87336.1 hypothetical protein DSCOOX_05160 [Desulfosarcina ovata subsp. ovata]
MSVSTYAKLFPQHVLDEIFSPQRADRFFEALFGDVNEGAYDIRLAYRRESEDRIEFEFQLIQRPGRCLACNLTHGLPNVFMRHPVIDINGVVAQIGSRMTNGMRCGKWQLGRTREVSTQVHVMPLQISLVPATPSGDN